MGNSTSRFAAVISYITWIGWIIAFIIRDRSDAYTTQHVNQALVINLLVIAAGIVSVVPHLGVIVSSVVGIAVLVFRIMGIYRAVVRSTEPLPIIGEIRLIG